MHQLIAIVVEARTAEEASSIAEGLFWPGPDTASLIPPFNNGKLLTHDDARYTNAVPDCVQENGAIRADTDAGQKLIEDRWGAQMKELRRYYSVVEAAIERDNISLADIFNDVRVEDVEVEPWAPLGLKCDGVGAVETASERILHAMYQLGRGRGPSIHLYDKNGWGIKGGNQYNELLNDIDALSAASGENQYFVVPADVNH